MQIIQQDILSIDTGVIVHQVNCFGKIGGLAKKIFAKYPRCLARYLTSVDLITNKADLLGTTQLVKETDTLYVANLFGQFNISYTDQATDYEAVNKALTDLSIQIQENMLVEPIYFPYEIGCGLGGGNWETYSELLATHFPKGIICELKKY